MLKKLIVGTLSAIVVTAVGVSAYNTMAGPKTPDVSQTVPTSTSAQVPAAVIAAQEDSPAWQGNTTNNVTPGSGQGAAWQSQENTAGTNLGQQGNTAVQGSGNGYRGGGRGRNNSSASQSSSGVSNPQNGFQEWITLSGTVSNYLPPAFNLLTADGQTVPVQLGNLNYVAQLGLQLQEGQLVTVTGYYDSSGSLAIGQITLDESGQTYVLRDDLGRPVWGGGPNR